MAEIEEGRKFEKIALDCLKQNNLSEAESNFLQALKHMEQSRGVRRTPIEPYSN